MRKALIICSSAAAVGFGVWWWRKKVIRMPLASSGDCEAQCDADPDCRAYSMSASGACSVSQKDPYAPANWVQDPSWSLHVKRSPPDAAPSFWSDWTPCPKCGPSAGTTTRKCTGKCAGVASKPCPAIPLCPKSEEIPDGWAPWPAGTTYQSLTSGNEPTTDSCYQKCLGDPTCHSYAFKQNTPSMGVCLTSALPSKGIMLADTASSMHGYKGYFSTLDDPSFAWGPWPDCPCGVPQVTRKCAKGTCTGPNIRICPNKPCSSLGEWLKSKLPRI